MLKILGSAIALFFMALPIYAEVAVFPYRVENPSENFANDSGKQYAKLLTVALSLSTRLDVTSQRDVLTDSARMGLDPDRTISSDDLLTLGRHKSIEYIFTGRISKAGNRYISESILFSVKEARIIQRAKITASSLFELASKDIHEFFPMYEKPMPKYTENMLDIAFLVDCSFAASREWPSIKEGIIDSAEFLTQGGRTSLRVYVIPFSDSYGFDKSFVAENSIMKLKENLNRLKPAGTHSDASFARGLQYAVKSILWRKNAGRKIILITNSRLSTSGFPQQHSAAAKQAGLTIDAIMLGRLEYNTAEVPLVLASGSGGTASYASYHQRVFNANGQSRDLFFERGRLLYSASALPEWKQGVFKTNKFNPAAAMPHDALDEVRSEKLIADPYSLPSVYDKSAGERVVNSGKLEDNIAYVIKNSVSGIKGLATTENIVAGKITVTDGNTSVIIDVPKKEDMRFFENKQQSGEFLNIGVTLSVDKESAYGLRFTAVSRNLNTEDIPSLINVSIRDIAQKKEQYMRNGLLSPPVWFLRVKVQQVRNYSEAKDIRDEY